MLILTNHAAGTLAESIDDAATALTLDAGQGARFPVPNTAGDWFPVTLVHGSGVLEIAHCTARFGDVLTVTRGADNTTALPWPAGTRVDLRLTVAAMANFANAAATDEALGLRPRVDAPQAFTSGQKAQLQANMGLIADPAPQAGRLTLTSGLAVTTADVTNAGTIYFTTFRGNVIWLYSGGLWRPFTFPEIPHSLAGTAQNTIYDLFAYDNDGDVALEHVAWANGTTRATGLVLTDGIPTKAGDATRRCIGSFRTEGNNQVTDSLTNRYLWNMNNRVERPMRVFDETTSWTYATSAWRVANANSANRLHWIQGLAEDVVQLELTVTIGGNAGAGGLIGIGINGNAPFGTARPQVFAESTASRIPLTTTLRHTALGRTYAEWMEYWTGPNASMVPLGVSGQTISAFTGRVMA